MTTEQVHDGAGARVAPALCFRGVTFGYRDDAPPAVVDLDLAVAPGEVVAVVGGNGSGKSTLARRLANGLLQPQQGEVLVGGLSTADHAHRWDIHARVGLLFQDPEDQIVGTSVEDDVAFGLENLGVARDEMRRRVGAVLASVGLAGEASTEPHLLSGGEKQRLALAGVLVLEPSVLILDEPTSMLDPAGRSEVMGFVRDLADRGTAVVMITQHMDEALAADRLVALRTGTVGFEGTPRAFFATGAYADFPLGPTPAMVLWDEVQEALGGGAVGVVLSEDDIIEVVTVRAGGDALTVVAGDDRVQVEAPPVGPAGTEGAPPPAGPDAEAAVRLSRVEVTYNARTPFHRQALRDVTLSVPEGSVTAVVGPTAAGKSTLLQVVAGLLTPSSGTMTIAGRPRPRSGEVGMVFQRPEIQLFSSTVWDDVAVAPRLQGVEGQALSRRVEWALDAVGLDVEVFGRRGPYSLSVGEQRRVALAGILSLQPSVLVLDEPGSGLDPTGRRRLMSLLVQWAREADPDGLGTSGRTLIFTSHDLDEVAVTADHVVVLHQGTVEAYGPAETVLGDVAMLARVGLRPTLASRVALRVGAEGAAGPLPVTGPSLAGWLERQMPA